MGHRHTPEECDGARAVCGADRGPAAAVAERRGGEREAVSASARTAASANHIESDGVKFISLGVRLALFALRFYKAYLSLLFAGSCRFEPSCSRYSYEAIERFGVGRGSWLTLKRLLRCQPLSRKFGYDPVPETWDEIPPGSATGVGGRSVRANEVHS
jgi:uncharacterized protein